MDVGAALSGFLGYGFKEAAKPAAQVAAEVALAAVDGSKKKAKEDFDPAKSRQDPFATMVQLGLLYDKAVGTKLRFAEYQIYHEPPGLTTAAKRQFITGANHNQLLQLEKRIKTALKYHSTQDPLTHFIFSRTIWGLKKFKPTYEKEDFIKNAIKRWIKTIDTACKEKKPAVEPSNEYGRKVRDIWSQTQKLQMALALGMPAPQNNTLPPSSINPNSSKVTTLPTNNQTKQPPSVHNASNPPTLSSISATPSANSSPDPSPSEGSSTATTSRRKHRHHDKAKTTNESKADGGGKDSKLDKPSTAAVVSAASSAISKTPAATAALDDGASDPSAETVESARKISSESDSDLSDNEDGLTAIETTQTPPACANITVVDSILQPNILKFKKLTLKKMDVETELD